MINLLNVFQGGCSNALIVGYSACPSLITVTGLQPASWKEPRSCDANRSLIHSGQRRHFSLSSSSNYPQQSFTMSFHPSLPLPARFGPLPASMEVSLRRAASAVPLTRRCSDLHHLHVNINCGICDKEMRQGSHCMLSESNACLCVSWADNHNSILQDFPERTLDFLLDACSASSRPNHLAR